MSIGPNSGRGGLRVAAPADASDTWTPELCWTLGFLTVISMFNYLDRSLLGLTLPLIKAEFQLSDTALGLISGLAFVLFYSTLGIPIASLADRSNRKNIVSIGFGFWSLMTAVTGWITNGWQLAATRFLMGAGEAAGLAPSQSMIADKFSKAKRPLALAIFTSASALDGIMLVPIAAWIADTYGWRTVFHVAGFAGVLLAIVFFFTVKEPVRGTTDDDGAPQEKVGMRTAIVTLIRSKAYLYILAGASFMGGALYAAGTWSTAFMVRVHGLSITEIGAIIGPVRGVLGAVGILVTGLIAERLGRRDPRWRIWVPAITCLVFVPGQILFLMGDSSLVWMSGLAITSTLSAAYQGPIYAAVIGIAPSRMRAVAISVLVFCTGLLGQIFGPLIVGALNDLMRPQFGDLAIRYSLLVVALCSLAGGISFLAASRVMDSEAKTGA